MSDESKQRRKPGPKPRERSTVRMMIVLTPGPRQRLEKTNDRRKRTSSEIVGEARDEWLINDEEEWP